MTLRFGEASSFLKSARRADTHYSPRDIEALSYKPHQPPHESNVPRFFLFKTSEVKTGQGAMCEVDGAEAGQA